jgi:hypothetical protein
MENGAKFLQRGFELFFGLFLTVPGILDTADEQVAFVVAELFQSRVIGPLATGWSEQPGTE